MLEKYFVSNRICKNYSNINIWFKVQLTTINIKIFIYYCKVVLISIKNYHSRTIHMLLSIDTNKNYIHLSTNTAFKDSHCMCSFTSQL